MYPSELRQPSTTAGYSSSKPVSPLQKWLASSPRAPAQRPTGAGCRFTLHQNSFHCIMYGRVSTNAGAAASSSRVLTGQHHAPHSEYLGAYGCCSPHPGPAGGRGASSQWPRAIITRGPGACSPSALELARRRPGGGPAAARGGILVAAGRKGWWGRQRPLRTLRKPAPQTGGRAVAQSGQQQLQSRQNPRCYRLAALQRPPNDVSCQQLPSLSPEPKHS